MSEPSTKTKILLFFPSYRSLEAAPPLALLALAAVLEERGYRVDVIDSTVEPRYKERIVAQLDESICLGISIVTGPMIHEAIEVAQAVKAARADFPVILGGWHPSTLARQTLNSSYVDVVVRGQGELTMAEIVERFAAGDDLNGVAGCSFRAPDGTLVENLGRPTANIETLPPKAYHLVDLEPYATLCGRRWLMYTSSHGCPYDCSFCSNASLYGRAWNALGPNRVVDEVVALVRRFRLDMVDIVDDNFLVDRQRGLEIASGFLASGEKFEWTIQSTANFLLKMSDEEVRLLGRSGLDRVFIGAESGSDEVLASVNKVRFQGTGVLFDVAGKLFRAGITGTFSLIFGLPGETDGDRKATLEMIRQIKHRFPNMEFHSNIYTPYPGAPNFRHALEMGLKRTRDAGRVVPVLPEEPASAVAGRGNPPAYPVDAGIHPDRIRSRTRPTAFRPSGTRRADAGTVGASASEGRPLHLAGRTVVSAFGQPIGRLDLYPWRSRSHVMPT